MSCRFDTANDLHIDHFSDRGRAGIDSVDFVTLKNPGSEVLVIAGDTSNDFSKTKKLLKKATEYYKHVLFVDGNHEHYSWQQRRSISLNETYMKEFGERHPEIVYLSVKDFRLGSTVFVGCSGWYDWAETVQHSKDEQKRAWEKYSNDSNIITSIPMDVLAQIHANNLFERVKSLDVDPTVEHIVVVTHTAPMRDLLEYKPWDATWECLSGSYCNTQMHKVMLASPKITTWVYGHTHERKLIQRNDILFVNNARGYASDQTKGSQWSLIQLDSAG